MASHDACWDLQAQHAAARTQVIEGPLEISETMQGRQTTKTIVQVVLQDCVELCKQLWASSKGQRRIAVLNFASGTSPGGMFRAAATKAQEESLCARSSLIDCLESEAARPFYEANRALRGSAKRLQTHSIIYSPAVPFRHPETEDGHFLVDVISSPAVHAAGYSLQRRAEGATAESIADDIATAMLTRIRRILTLAAAKGVDDLVLGAFGCGVFGNSSEAVAGFFRTAIEELLARDAYCFHGIFFALMDPRSDVTTPFLAPQDLT